MSPVVIWVLIILVALTVGAILLGIKLGSDLSWCITEQRNQSLGSPREAHQARMAALDEEILVLEAKLEENMKEWCNDTRKHSQKPSQATID